MIDYMNIVVFHVVTGDLLPYRIIDDQIVIIDMKNIDIDDCLVTVWENLPGLNKKYGFVKEKES